MRLRSAFLTMVVRISKPSKSEGGVDSRLFPNECREGHRSYTGTLSITITKQINDGNLAEIVLQSGDAPMMVKSKGCHLRHLDQAGLIKHREEEGEMVKRLIQPSFPVIVVFRAAISLLMDWRK
jgi:hypothetical protein